MKRREVRRGKLALEVVLELIKVIILDIFN